MLRKNIMLLAVPVIIGFMMTGTLASDEVPRIHRYTTEHWIIALMEDRSDERRYSWGDNSRERAVRELSDRVRWWPEPFGSGKYAKVILTMFSADQKPFTVRAHWRDVLEETYEPEDLHERALQVVEYIGAHLFTEQMKAQGDQEILEDLLDRFPRLGELLTIEKNMRDPRNAVPHMEEAMLLLSGDSEERFQKALKIMQNHGWKTIVNVLDERELFEMFGYVTGIFEFAEDSKTWELAFDAAHGIMKVLHDQKHPRLNLFQEKLDRDLLPAFPGAEGAGKYARGGRGGDVYHVTNLKDSGPGSFRYGLETADGPRTIVFDVAGTIRLENEIEIADKPFLTIAGQTAPGMGVTIADSDVGFTQMDHLVIQNLRFAPGDTHTRPESKGKTDHRPRGKMNALRVRKSDFVMIDHLVTKWATEQTLSLTSGHSGGRLPTDPNSRNMTVQYSMIVEAFFDGDHHKGERGFATYLRGSHSQTWHHNLFVHNASRTPKIGHVQAEWVNNVLYNGNVGYTNQRVHTALNYAGNVYIDGTDDPYGVGPFLYGTGKPLHSKDDAPVSNFLFYSTSPYHYIYHSAPDQLDRNYLDPWKDQPFELIPAPDHAVGAREYTRFDQPFDISDYKIRTGRQAYIDVMSRSGIHRRDLHDHRIIREVISKTGMFIDRQSDLTEAYGIEPWPVLDTGESVTSTARDGIADWWKELHGLDIHKAYHRKRTAAGYTWLEKYLHSLTSHAYPPQKTVKHEIFPGSIEERDGYYILVFDLSEIEPGSGRDAVLEVEFSGITQDDIGSAQVDDGTASIYARDYRWEGSESVTGYRERAGISHLLELGRVTTGTANNIRFVNPNLVVFLNTRAYHPDDRGKDVITLVVGSLAGDPKPDGIRLVVDADSSLLNK